MCAAPSSLRLLEIVARMNVSEDLLDQTCSPQHAHSVAKQWDRWRNGAFALSFSHSDVQSWDRDSRNDEEGKCSIMLTRWLQKMGQKATYRTLATALLESERTDLVEKLLTELKGSEELHKESRAHTPSGPPSLYPYRSVFPQPPRPSTNFRGAREPPPRHMGESSQPFSAPASHPPSADWPGKNEPVFPGRPNHLTFLREQVQSFSSSFLPPPPQPIAARSESEIVQPVERTPVQVSQHSCGRPVYTPNLEVAMEGLSFCEMHGVRCKHAEELKQSKERIAELELLLSLSNKMEYHYKQQLQMANKQLSLLYRERELEAMKKATYRGVGGGTSPEAQNHTDYNGESDDTDGPRTPHYRPGRTVSHSLRRTVDVVTEEKADSRRPAARCTCEARRAFRRQISSESLRFRLQVVEERVSIRTEQVGVVSANSRRLSENGAGTEQVVSVSNLLETHTVDSHKTLQDFRLLQTQQSQNSDHENN